MRLEASAVHKVDEEMVRRLVAAAKPAHVIAEVEVVAEVEVLAEMEVRAT